MFGSLAILIALGLVTMTAGFIFEEEFTIPNTPAEDAKELLTDAFPNSDTGAQVQVVFKAPEGETLDSEAFSKDITDMLNSIKDFDSDVGSVASPSTKKYSVPSIST
ncbi:hypothetical protein [Sporosarcina globispora]|uniref:hypothetical protein n=1 Tax=Sporosarcina globispora TaxID=1459 RepID=UPI0006A97251|nr:hypothetical protein [Sporosarcina globispora]